MKLYAHPFSSYCQKVLIALYENHTPFVYEMLGQGTERAAAEHAALWPLKRIPVLVDARRTVVEATIIIEHLGLHHPAPVRLIPGEPDAAIDVRLMDRFFDNYVLNDVMAGREWAAGDAFSLADCAAAPALFYADWAHPIDKARPYRHLFPLGAPDRD